MTGGLSAADLEAIRAVFARRLYVMDTKQWDGYGPCHTEDVVSESWAASGGAAQVRGREALTAAIRDTLDGASPVTSVHHGHTPLIEYAGPDPETGEPTATGIWAMEDLLWWAVRDRERHLHGWGIITSATGGSTAVGSSRIGGSSGSGSTKAGSSGAGLVALGWRCWVGGAGLAFGSRHRSDCAARSGSHPRGAIGYVSR